MSSVTHVKAALDSPTTKPDTALEPYTFGSFTFTATGLTVQGAPEIGEWQAVGHMLAVQARGLQFMVGDWLRYGEERYGELAAQAIDARSWSDESVRNFKWVAKSVPMENRREDLTFKHHQLVAHLPPAQQRKWLKQAATSEDSGAWPASRLAAAIKEGGDEAPTAWYVLVEAKSQAKRDALQKELELAGHQCKAVERRGGRREGD